MKTIKGWIPTTFLAMAIAFSATTANAGILVGNFTGEQETAPCTENAVDKDGILVGNIIGILVGNFTGILVGNLTDVPQENCGILVGN